MLNFRLRNVRKDIHLIKYMFRGLRGRSLGVEYKIVCALVHHASIKVHVHILLSSRKMRPFRSACDLVLELP